MAFGEGTAGADVTGASGFAVAAGAERSGFEAAGGDVLEGGAVYDGSLQAGAVRAANPMSAERETARLMSVSGEKSSTAANVDEERHGDPPVALEPQPKSLKTLPFRSTAGFRLFLDSHYLKHYGPRGFLGRQDLPGFAALSSCRHEGR